MQIAERTPVTDADLERLIQEMYHLTSRAFEGQPMVYGVLQGTISALNGAKGLIHFQEEEEARTT